MTLPTTRQQLSRALAISALCAVPLPTLAADLTIAWEEGFYPEEDKAIEAVVLAYEQASGKDVELRFEKCRLDRFSGFMRQ